MRLIVTLITIDHMKIEDNLEEEDITRIGVEDHWIEMTRVEDIQEEEDPLTMQDPQ